METVLGMDYNPRAAYTMKYNLKSSERGGSLFFRECYRLYCKPRIESCMNKIIKRGTTKIGQTQIVHDKKNSSIQVYLAQRIFAIFGLCLLLPVVVEKDRKSFNFWKVAEESSKHFN